MAELELGWVDERVYAVCRLAPDETVPLWMLGAAGFSSITRTADELSIVMAEEQVPAGVTAERGFRLLRVVGTLDFGLTGILSHLTGRLAEAGLSVFALSTYDTDYLLIRSADIEAAEVALGM